MERERIMQIGPGDTVFAGADMLKVLSHPDLITWNGELIARFSACSPIGRTVVLDHRDVTSIRQRTTL